MDNSPLFSPNTPRFAPPRMHVRNASQSPTRKRFADDLLSDLSPATTLEAFTNPSGKLKASIEAASTSERAFGLRATMASKKIQEWVEELSNWPWPAEGGSIGFEMPATKRRKLSDPFVDHNSRQNSYEQTGMTNGDALKYIGSLLAEEVDRYEVRIDEIQADMEDLNVEDIKRQVLDTHFSPRSRPSSSGSNAPTPQFLSSYTKMDDFTAIVTSTVLQSLPNLSRLMRLMDVWSIRLSVLRKVPPLLLALEDIEVALKSGWNAIRTPTANEEYLSRETFTVMRNVLREKVTTLGQNLDFLLDTLEGRQDTLPDIWLDRMEVIENDYGNWDVAADRKVREGEWAKLTKKRKEEEDARRLRDEQEAETARRKAEQQAKEEAERIARQQAEDEARWRAEKEAQEAEAAEIARLQAEKDAEEAARLKAQMEAEAIEAAGLEAECKAAEAEEARIQAQREAEESAKRKAEQEAADIARRKAEEEAAEAARTKAQQEAEHAEAVRLQALKDAEEEAIRKQQLEVELAEAARRKAEHEAQDLARRKAEEEAAEATRLKARKDAEDNAIRKAQVEAEIAEAARLEAEQEAQNAARRQAEQEAKEAAARKAQQEAEEARLAAEKEAQEAAIRMAQLEAEAAERLRLQAQREAEEAETAERARLKAENDAIEVKLAEEQAPKKAAEALAAEAARIQAEEDARKRKAEKDEEDAERVRIQAQREAEEAAVSETARRKASEDARMEPARLQAERDSEVPRREEEAQGSQAATRDAEDGASRQAPECTICADLQDVDESASLRKGARVAMGSSTSTEVSTQSSNFFDAVKPSVTSYAPYDGVDESSAPLFLSPSDDTRLDYDSHAKQVVLDSPIHLNDRPFPVESLSPTSPTKSKSVEPRGPVTPPSQKIPRFGHAFANAIRRASSSPHASSVERTQSSRSSQHDFSLDAQDNRSPKGTSTRPRSPVKLLFPPDGAHDLLASSQAISKSNEDGWVVSNSSNDEDVHPSDDLDNDRLDSIEGSPTKSRNSASSAILGYPTDPTPEIQEAEPAEYFQPVFSPIKSARSPVNGSEPTTPSKPAIKIDEAIPSANGPPSPGSPFVSSPRGMTAIQRRMSPSSDGACEICDSFAEEGEVERPPEPVLARKTSISLINNGVRRISIPRRDSISSEASTVIKCRASEPPSSPMASPLEVSFLKSSFNEKDEVSPSAGRIGLRDRNSYDSPPDSPAPAPRMSPKRSLQILKSPNLFPPDSNTAPSTPVDAPVFANLDLTTAPMVSSPKKATTDEQIQQQISSLLESIPARIRLTSEPDGTPFTSQTLRPKKTRRSVTPNLRPSSSLSNYSTSTTYSRAPTPGPQFTLAPAFAKTGQRTRTYNGNPEIKLYHLSRSTGEAPIKLFVRLVGEHGERVMVRVGGGWADLGEYLKEYASHHGRRSAADAGDKVEIQDLPPRAVSISSATSTVRGSGRDTPQPRSFSVMERERPGSSLNVRKTRKSIGANDPSPIPTRINDTRSPSTPLPIATRRAFETPPSVASVASSSSNSGTGPSGRSSRLSWTEEDSSLGLAGPKSKKVVISERDQEWVESMKEKVRLASAEKEKKEKLDRDRERKTSFGEMDRVGGTKRLFRKG